MPWDTCKEYHNKFVIVLAIRKCFTNMLSFCAIYVKKYFWNIDSLLDNATNYLVVECVIEKRIEISGKKKETVIDMYV